MPTKRERIGLATVTALAAMAACTANTLPPKGQLMVVVSSNLAPPKDFDAFRIRVVQQGREEPAHDFEYSMTGSQATKLPATLAVVAGADPNQTVTITVTASRGGKARIERQAIVRVPPNRVASLPLPVDGLCVDVPCPTGADGKAQTCIAGTCQAAEVDESKLADFDRGAIFGGGTGNGDGTCFDTLDCFSAGKSVSPDNGNRCSIAKETGAGINVGVVRPAGSDGICAINACIVPIDRDPFTGPEVVTGWREDGERILLPRAICDRSLPVMITTKCPTKSAPMCGPWSSVGGSSIGSDGTTLPFDGGVPGDASLPSNVPQSIRFADGDVREGFVKGTVTIARAPEESGITGYRLYWGDGPNKKLDLIATLPKTGTDVTHPLEGPMLAGSSHLYAVSFTGSTEIAPHVSAGPIDNFVRRKQIGTDQIIYYPDTLVDAKNQRLLVVGYDESVNRQHVVMLRCQLDGSGCTHHDLGTAAVAASGAVIDETNGKIIAMGTRGGPPAFFRCNLDGSGCDPEKNVNGSLTGTISRIRLLVDDANKKLIAVFGASNTSDIYRCDLDGTNCTATKFGGGVLSGGADPDAVIDKAANKLLVVGPGLRDAFTGAPFLFRCDIDGTSCGVKDVGGTNTEMQGALSIALDEKNQKLVIVSTAGSSPQFQFTRCNLEGEACTYQKLPDPGTNGPMRPHVILDPVHEKIFVFSHGSARATAQRCELDGTGCTPVVSLTASYGMLNVRAALHDGKLFAVGPKNSGTPGFDFASFLSY